MEAKTLARTWPSHPQRLAHLPQPTFNQHLLPLVSPPLLRTSASRSLAPASSCIPHPDDCHRIFSRTRWAALLLYRALLVGGIGLLFETPALASTSSHPAHEVVVEKDAGKTKENVEAENGASINVTRGKNDESINALGAESARCESTNALGDDFWKDISLPKGSTELMLKIILDKDPLNVSALECLAKRLLEVDDSAHAVTVLEKLEALQPNEIEWKYMKSEAYDLDGQFQRAKQGFEDILKIEPFSSKALQGLIMVMDQLNESEEALKIAMDTMIKAKQENNTKEARNIGILIGQIHTLKGRFEEALKHFKLMIEEDVHDFRPYLCQGIIYSILGEKQMAEEHFKNFEELCPKELPGRPFLDGLMSRARKEGERAHGQKENLELQ